MDDLMDDDVVDETALSEAETTGTAKQPPAKKATAPPAPNNKEQKKSPVGTAATPNRKLQPFKKDVPPRSKKKTQFEKRQRQSGKNTDKPYISSSMGDMCRLMIRMACTENTLNYTDPPPVEFYDYWHKFKIAETTDKLPYQHVDTRKVSIPRLKMNTSSYDIMAKNAASVQSLAHIIESSPGGGDKKSDAFRKLAPTLSELWKNVRLSMSTESFISSSTKVSEQQENVPLECGWSDDDDDDLLLQAILSDDDDMGGSSTASFVGTGGEYGSRPSRGIERRSEANKTGTNTGGSGASSRQSGLLLDGAGKDDDDGGGANREMGAMAGSLLRMEMEDARHAWEHAIHIGKFAKRDDVIDHFMQDLDDTFLMDAISYGMLPDTAFIPEFDYFNEDPIYKEMERERERLEYEAANPKRGRKKGADAKKKDAKTKGGKMRTMSETTLTTDGGEGEMEAEFCTDEKPKPSLYFPGERDDYQTCLAKQKKRIEAKLLAAVKCRTAMGDYIVPPGEQPLAETFSDAGPGPAAYTPNVNAIKPSPTGVFLTERWSKSIYDTPGPGPAAYFPNCNKCTGEMLNLHFAPRFEKSETVGPGPGHYDTLKNTTAGKDKPHARIISRPPPAKLGCGGSRYVNIFGFNQFGKRNPPSALIISKHELRDRSEVTQRPGVGPGSYDPPVFKNTRIGITIKSRIPGIAELHDSPNFVALPPLIGQGAVSMGSRKFTNIEPCSPGPIYQVPHPGPKPVSMTFKPFPTRGREDEPSPIHWGTVPGEQCIKTKPRAPCPILHGNHDLNYGKERIPGPQYSIQDCKCTKGITLVGRYKTKTDQSPGPYLIGNSDLPQGPRAVFQNKWKIKELVIPPKCDYHPEKKVEFNPQDPCTLEFITPKDVTHRITGGVMSARWPSKFLGDDDEPGPRFHNTFGFTNRGKYSKIPMSLKSRHSPFVYTHLSKTAEVPNQKTCDLSQKPKNTNPC